MHTRSRRVAAESPVLDGLEPRVFLSTVQWTGAGDGLSWHDGQNWDTGSVPGITDDAIIDDASDPTIQFTADTGDRIVRSLISRENLSFSGGSLSVLTTAEVDAVVGLDGGTLTGGSWDVSQGLMQASSTRSRLVGLEVTGDIRAATIDTVARLSIEDALTHHGTLFAAGADLRFANALTYSTGTIELEDTTLAMYGNTVIAADAVVRATATQATLGNNDDYTLINHGLIDGGDANLYIEVRRFENRGTLTGGAGEIELDALEMLNAGQIDISLGTLEFGYMDWSNTGHIASTDALVRFDGLYDNADIAPERFTRNGGVVVLRGALNNTGAALNISGNLADAQLHGPRITGGTINVPSGADLQVHSATLFGPITLNGDALVDSTSGNRTLDLAGAVQINGIIRLADATRLTLHPDADVPGLTVQTLALADTQITVESGTLDSDTSLLVGAGSELSLAGGRDTTLTSGAFISLSGASMLQIAGDAFVNEGVVRAGVDTRLEILATDWTNRGEILALGARWALLGAQDSRWRNEGTITLHQTELRLDGRFTPDELGWDGFNVTDTDVLLWGVLENTGSTFEFGPDTGIWDITNDGTIEGGQIVVVPGYEPALTYARFVGPISVVGNLTAASRLSVSGDLDIDGFLSIEDATIEFQGLQTLSGSILLSGTSNQFQFVQDDSVLTLAPDTVLHIFPGTDALVRDLGSSIDGTLINQGLIQVYEDASLRFDQHAFQNPGRLVVGSDVSLETDLWSSTGTIELNTGELHIDGAEALSSEINTAGITSLSGTIVLSGRIDNTGHTLAIDTDVWSLDGGTIERGVVVLSGPLDVRGTSSLFTGPIEIQGDLTLRGITEFSGDLTLRGTASLGQGARLAFEGPATIHAGTFLLSPESDEYLYLNVENRGDTVTLGAEVVIRGGSTQGTRFHGVYARLVNQGQIIAETGSIRIATDQFVNQGALAVTSGATLTVDANEWSTTGTVQISGGTFELGGRFASDAIDLAGFQRSGGTIAITGEMDNTGRTFAPPSGLGAIDLDGGTIAGGTVTMANNRLLRIGDNFGTSLEGPMEFNGIINVSYSPGAVLTITGGLTLNGRLQLANGGQVRLENTQTIDGTAEVVFFNTGAPGELLAAGGHDDVITLGPDIVIRGGHAAGALIHSLRNQTILLLGELRAEGDGLSIYAIPANFVNNGSARAVDEASLYATASGSYSGGMLRSGTWSVEADSTLRIFGATIRTIGPDAAVTLTGVRHEFAGIDGLSRIDGTLTIGEDTHITLTPSTGTLTNAGTLILEASAALVVTGDYVQTAGGAFVSTIDSLVNRHAGYIRATGTAQVAGAFEMRYRNTIAYEGESFEVVTANNGVSGRFDTVTLPGPSHPTDRVLVMYDADQIRVFNTDLADFNLDGTVDTRDFVLFLNLWTAQDTLADTNGDGVIDSRDFVVFLNWFTDG